MEELVSYYGNKRIQKWKTFKALAKMYPKRYKVTIERDKYFGYSNERYEFCGVLYDK